MDVVNGTFANGSSIVILKDSWCDQELPISFGKDARDNLRGLRTQVEDAKAYAQVEPVVYASSCCVDTCAVMLGEFSEILGPDQNHPILTVVTKKGDTKIIYRLQTQHTG